MGCVGGWIGRQSEYVYKREIPWFSYLENIFVDASSSPIDIIGKRKILAINPSENLKSIITFDFLCKEEINYIQSWMGSSYVEKKKITIPILYFEFSVIFFLPKLEHFFFPWMLELL